MSTQVEKYELACAYAALLLHSAEIEITADKISEVAKAAGITLPAVWPAVFAKTLETAKMEQFVSCSAAPAAAPAAAAAAPAAAEAAPAEEKKEEKKEEEEEEDMDMGGLFD